MDLKCPLQGACTGRRWGAASMWKARRTKVGSARPAWSRCDCPPGLGTEGRGLSWRRQPAGACARVPFSRGVKRLKCSLSAWREALSLWGPPGRAPRKTWAGVPQAEALPAPAPIRAGGCGSLLCGATQRPERELQEEGAQRRRCPRRERWRPWALGLRQACWARAHPLGRAEPVALRSTPRGSEGTGCPG